MAIVTIRALVVFAFLSAACNSPAATAGTPTAPASAQTPATDPAGTVVAVKGEVQAANAAGAARVLAQGDGVWPDETVKTARDATIDIRLRHNGVVWSMRGGLQKRVDQSLAWTAPKASTSNVLFSTVADASRVSAGRHSENEAAHSAESLLQNEKKKSDARFGAARDLAPGGGGGASAGASAGASRDELGAESSRSSNGVASKEEPKPQPQAKLENSKSPEKTAQTAKSTGALSARASSAASAPAPAPAPASVVAPPAETAGVEKDRADSGAVLGDAISPASDKPATRAVGWAVSEAGARTPADLEKVLNAIRLDRCAARTLAIAFRAQIEADGRVGELVLLDAQGGDAADLLCIEEALRTANFGAAAPGVVSIRFAR